MGIFKKIMGKKNRQMETSDSYGKQVTYLGDKKLSDFLDEVGIKLTPPVARGTKRKMRKDKGKKHHMTKKHKKSRCYS